LCRCDPSGYISRRAPIADGLANAIDCWDGRTFRRVVTITGQPMEVSVRQDGKPDHALLQVNLTGQKLTRGTQMLAKSLLDRILRLRWDLTSSYQPAKCDRKVTPLVGNSGDLKPPRFPTVFEAAVNYACLNPRTVEELPRAWSQMEKRARVDECDLVLMGRA
jgi:DNA-3-methyladenine glycosylase II